MNSIHAAAVHASGIVHPLFAVGDPVAYDYAPVAGTILLVLGGIVAGLLLVVAAALGVKAVTWGVPKLIRFFTRLAG